jgi:hypothetical protein
MNAVLLATLGCPLVRAPRAVLCIILWPAAGASLRHHPTRASRQQAAGSRQQAAGSRQQAAGSRQQAAGRPGAHLLPQHHLLSLQPPPLHAQLHQLLRQAARFALRLAGGAAQQRLHVARQLSVQGGLLACVVQLADALVRHLRHHAAPHTLGAGTPAASEPGPATQLGNGFISSWLAAWLAGWLAGCAHA